MRFSKLRLNGFKSFVDPTDMVIADGLTGVVGPNGCGKSNLLEALRWVMGENRASAMRGGGMEDVIFAGAATRPARNFAEVALIIDNTDRLAPAAFNDADQLEIVRRITRDAGSAYRVGARDVRARDVQMLFADASTGAHSPALVRQGMISELINAKPKARRRILEEAAGISGLYQRRHEAELKLAGAESNLARVDDVTDQLAAQLAQLARQARQAARYREIGTALRRAEGMLLVRRWHAADLALLDATNDLRVCITAAAGAERSARDAAAACQRANDALPPLREEQAIAAAVLQRLAVQRDTLRDRENRARDVITGLRARIDQLTRDLDREAGLNHDAGDTVQRLEWEAREIAKAGDGHAARLEQAQDAARIAAAALQQQEAASAAQTEDAARLAARHQSAQRLIADHRATLARATAQAAQSGGALRDATAALTRAETDFATAAQAEAAALVAAGEADRALTAAEAARADIQGRENDARAVRSQAEGEANALRAEVTALSRLIARERTDAGQVLDLVAVQSGYEKALGAALTDDLRAPTVGPDAATGWAGLPDYATAQPLPDGAVALRDFVTFPAVLARRMAQVGLVDGVDGARLQAALLPGQRLVSLAGDLWRWDGLRAAAVDAPSAAAARLQQINRLADLQRDLDTAAAAAADAIAAHDTLGAALRDCTAVDQAARTARRDADRAVADANRASSRAEADRNLAQGRLETLSLALRRSEDDAAAARTALADAEQAAAGLGDLTAARAAVEAAKTQLQSARAQMMSLRATADDLRREGDARLRRSQQIATELSGWKHRRDTATKRSDELVARKTAATTDLAAAAAAPDAIAAERATLADAIAAAETRRGAAGDALALAETAARTAAAAERDAERAAGQTREARARADARADAARETVADAAARILDAQGVSPAQLLATLDIAVADMPPVAAVENDVANLKRQRDALGAVNLRAEEDSKAVQTEHDALIAEKADLLGAITALRTGITALNREGRERLLSAFAQVNENFGLLFTHLFGGGEARLVLVESDDPLEAGLEIMCQPPGKKLSTLSLLSGGEQTLTALALIFAVFLANPAPICVLDEVDAPLDDANVTRFCDLLDEMTRRTQTRFLIITHHAVTMSRMDRLFGVTMGEQGVSQLVSVDLRAAAALVA